MATKIEKKYISATDKVLSSVDERSAAQYRLSSSWRLEKNNDQWLLYGGDDAKFEIEPADFLKALASGKRISRQGLSDKDRPLFEKLASAKALEAIISDKKSLAIQTMGDTLPCTLSLPKNITLTDSDPDLVLVVRHTSALHDIMLQATELEQDYLLIDMSFHHMFSVGPLVVPHETPCVSCLYGRINQRWGGAQPVERPAVVEDFPEMIMACIVTELKRIAAGDTSLVGQTVSWNWLDREVLREKLLTVPACKYCYPFSISGKIEL